MVTCGPDGGSGRVVALSVDGLGPAAALASQAGGAWLDDLVHVLHELELLPPQVLLLDELLAGLVLLLPQPLLLRLQPGGGASVTFTFTLNLFTLAYFWSFLRLFTRTLCHLVVALIKSVLQYC